MVAGKQQPRSRCRGGNVYPSPARSDTGHRRDCRPCALRSRLCHAFPLVLSNFRILYIKKQITNAVYSASQKSLHFSKIPPYKYFKICSGNFHTCRQLWVSSIKWYQNNLTILNAWVSRSHVCEINRNLGLTGIGICFGCYQQTWESWRGFVLRNINELQNEERKTWNHWNTIKLFFSFLGFTHSYMHTPLETLPLLLYDKRSAICRDYRCSSSITQAIHVTF